MECLPWVWIGRCYGQGGRWNSHWVNILILLSCVGPHPICEADGICLFLPTIKKICKLTSTPPGVAINEHDTSGFFCSKQFGERLHSMSSKQFLMDINPPPHLLQDNLVGWQA